MPTALPAAFSALVSIAFGLTALAGCASPPRSLEAQRRTQTDRLQQHYRDLASGRFAIVADFEEPTQAELFHLEPEATPGLSLQSEAGVKETGGTCLTARFAGGTSRLVADNRAAKDWLLKRDWRPYDLLVMGLHVPEEDLRLDLAITTGEGKWAKEAHSLVPLRRGWNLIRLDLTEAGAYVALDDVRRIEWSFPGLDQPVEVRLDDVLLTNNRQALFGSPEGAAGSLYVVRDGRSLRIGAVGRFELDFANGRIVRWYALDHDPLSLTNLVGRDHALGPMPVVLPPDDPEPAEALADWMAGWSALGSVVRTRQRVVEANAARVLIECQWDFAEGMDAVAPGDGRLSWTYAIYPSGQVYVTAACAYSDRTAPPENLGLAISRSLLPGMGVEVHEPGQLGDAADRRHLTYAWSAAADGSAGLLFVLRDSRQGPRVRVLRSADEPQLTLLTFEGVADPGGMHWDCLLSVWRDVPDREARWDEVALGYAAPPTFRFLVGSLGKDLPGNSHGDGFDERTGAFVLVPDANRVQLKIEGPKRGLVSPVFRVAHSAGREAWVYVDYVVYQDVARDANGDLFFQLPGTIDRETTVEVYLRAAPAK